MLSKSRGHVLRLATVLHLLFHLDDLDKELETEVPDSAVKAAVNFMEVSSQQTAFIAGRGTISEELEKFQAGEYIYTSYSLPLLRPALLCICTYIFS